MAVIFIVLHFWLMVEGVHANLHIAVDKIKGQRVRINETDAMSPTAQGLKPQGASAGKEVKDGCSLNLAGNDIEQ